jgi:PhzF family phenazine biosynthesis protein
LHISSSKYVKNFQVRSFAPLHGISEDPVCGSGNGAVGIFIRHSDQSAHFLDKNGTYTASQGAVVGRAGQIRVKLNGENVQIAGTAVTLVDGQLNV